MDPDLGRDLAFAPEASKQASTCNNDNGKLFPLLGRVGGKRNAAKLGWLSQRRPFLGEEAVVQRDEPE